MFDAYSIRCRRAKSKPPSRRSRHSARPPTNSERRSGAHTHCDRSTPTSRTALMPIWVQAGLWGLAAGGALVLGALLAWAVHVPQKVVASVMAFGAGVLISALAFDLVDEAETSGGLTATVLGFLVGAVVYVIANVALAKRGARHRKR